MHIYLSPHHDDVCFSIGHLAARQGGELVNVFTRSNYAAVPLRTDGQDRISCITGLRRDEDRLFVQQAGLIRHDLGLDETSALGFDSFDLSGLDEEIAMLRGTLISYLDALLPADARPQNSNLFCPMGIGGHRNHLSILLAVRDSVAALSLRCTIWLYEDLHYASNAEARRRGIIHARQAFAGRNLKATIVRLDAESAERKLDWIRLYRTQHRRPVEPGRYTPASGIEKAMHEMVHRCQTVMDM
jgi:hypothetical protein